MRWIDRLDAWSRGVDTRYEAWLEHRLKPLEDFLVEFWPMIWLVFVTVVLWYALASVLGTR